MTPLTPETPMSPPPGPDSRLEGGAPGGEGRLPLEVVHSVARLARLDVSASRAEGLRSELSAILGYAERLGSLELGEVAPLASPLDVAGPLAPDELDPAQALGAEHLRAMAGQMFESFVRIPRVLGETGGGA